MTRPILTGIVAALLALSHPASALERLDFRVVGADPDLAGEIARNSLLKAAENTGETDANDLIATAQADYTRILETLYAQGYYGGVIHILIDGREAANIPTFSAPTRVNTIVVTVEPGRVFRFGAAQVGPLSRETSLPPEFGRGEIAKSTVITEAVDTAVTGWREAGHAKVEVAGQSATADHRSSTLDVLVALAPGPIVRFGRLIQTTASAVRHNRIAKIAAFPEGEVFSPAALKAVAERLRKTGVFDSVSVVEAERLGPGNTMDVELKLVDAKPRRIGAGIELSSLEGMTVSGFWLHRNLFNRAMRFRVDGEVSDITGSGEGIDYKIGARLDIPAAFGKYTGAYVTAEIEYLDEPAYLAKQGGFGLGLSREFSPQIVGQAGLAYRYSITEDSLGERRFSLLSFPAEGTWDRRDNELNPAKGFYLKAGLEPFYEFEGETFGARATFDGRVYRAFGDADRLILAGRSQIGAVIGAAAEDVPPDYLFFGGGAGTVRGFPYQSLAIDAGGGDTIGGRAFLGLSAEVRYQFSERFGVVGFVDYAALGAETFSDGAGGSQTGAGIGLRYYSALGPIRLDVATPVDGPGGDGTQIYIGIGQSF